MVAKILTSILMLLSICSSAYGFNEPDGFLGIKWGTSREDARKAFQNISSDHFSGVTEAGSDSLLFSDSLGGAITKFLFTFKNDKFVDVSLRFDSKDFQVIEHIFVRRYGKPMQIENETVTTPMGVTLVNKKLYWIGKNIYITLFQYAGRLTEGLAMIGQMSQLQEGEKQKKREIDDAIKNM